MAKRASYPRVAIGLNRGSLRLRWRYEGKNYAIGFGPDTPVNRAKASQVALLISRDMAYGSFNPQALDRYREEGDLPPSKPMRWVWSKFVDSVRDDRSPKTLHNYEQVARALAACPAEPLRDLATFRIELSEHTTQAQAKKILQQMSHATRWAIGEGLLTLSKDPFEGVSQEIKAKKPGRPVAFTPEEIQRILAAFQASRHFQVYTPLVGFLAQTGCRPSEGIGLRWGAISQGCERIVFREGLVEAGGQLHRRPVTKTGVVRTFPATPKLQALLQSIRPADPGPDDLVFLAPKGGPIHPNGFSKRVFSSILTRLGLESKDGVRMSLYSLRDSFITAQILAGVPVSVIAAWVGNSPAVIERHYADVAQLSESKPVDFF